MFTKQFGKFASEGDTITCTVGKFTATATIYRDDSGDRPDQRDDGFWPSKDPKAAGYVDPAKYTAEKRKASRIMNAWLADEWFYCGVAVTVACEGVDLTGEYYVALWGVECNYPGTANEYLVETANELLGEALEQAKAKLASLCKAEG